MKNERTTGIPCFSANGATKVDTTAAARLPTARTAMTEARRPAPPGAGFAASAGDDDTVGDRRRQNQAPISATMAERTNTGRAPKRAAIGSPIAGPSALIDSAAAP